MSMQVVRISGVWCLIVTARLPVTSVWLLPVTGGKQTVSVSTPHCHCPSSCDVSLAVASDRWETDGQCVHPTLSLPVFL
ncbi:hypothetical protein ACOMHN_044110 [Nucella lapillus]